MPAGPARGRAAGQTACAAESDDTIRVPLASAETLPGGRLAPASAEEAPTLPIPPAELAALLRLMRPREAPGPPLPPAPSRQPIRYPAAAPIRSSDFGRTLPHTRGPHAGVLARPSHALMPTQLFLGQPAVSVPRRTAPARRRSLWARLWGRLSAAVRAWRRTPAPPCRPRSGPR